MTDDANLSVTDLERLARKDAACKKKAAQDDWITDPNDPRCASLPEWVPRPGEEALIKTVNYNLFVNVTVLAVRPTDDPEVVYIDMKKYGSRRLAKGDVKSVGTRYSQPYKGPRHDGDTSHYTLDDSEEYCKATAKLWRDEGREIGAWYRAGEFLVRLNQDGSIDETLT